MSTGNDTKWYVVCADYTAGPYRSSNEASRRQLNIEKAGHCHHRHEIVPAPKGTRLVRSPDSTIICIASR